MTLLEKQLTMCIPVSSSLLTFLWLMYRYVGLYDCNVTSMFYVYAFDDVAHIQWLVGAIWPSLSPGTVINLILLTYNDWPVAQRKPLGGSIPSLVWPGEMGTDCIICVFGCEHHYHYWKSHCVITYHLTVICMRNAVWYSEHESFQFNPMRLLQNCPCTFLSADCSDC